MDFVFCSFVFRAQQSLTQDMNQENDSVPTLRSMNDNSPRRRSAPYKSGRVESRKNVDADPLWKRNQVQQCLVERYRVHQQDVTPQMMQTILPFKATVSEIQGYFEQLSRLGEVYSTNDDYHWRPI